MNTRNNPTRSSLFDLIVDGDSGSSITTKEQLLESLGRPVDMGDLALALFQLSRSAREREEALSTKVEMLEEKVVGLEDRLLRAEAYSGRNTVILGSVPEPENESPADLETKVAAVLARADPTIRPEDLGIVHRNGVRGRRKAGKKSDAKKAEGPRTVTVVLTKARQKDNVMRKEGRAKLKSAGFTAWHRMSPALMERRKELEEVPGVNWVAFSGHRLFTVCCTDKKGKETFLRNVINVSDLQMA